jgi:hypothetical protein
MASLILPRYNICTEFPIIPLAVPSAAAAVAMNLRFGLLCRHRSFTREVAYERYVPRRFLKYACLVPWTCTD